MGISHMHVKHKPHRRAPGAAEVVEKRGTCSLYTTPKMGDTVDSLQPLPITWDPSCLSDKQIDIVLMAPTSQFPRIHRWESIWNDAGTYTAELMPRWWNTTDSVSLQISIVPHGNVTFLSDFPAGPIFTATYTEPASGQPASANVNVIDSGVTVVNAPGQKMNSGKTAAAVILPLLFVALCIGAFIKYKRSKGMKKRKQWTEAVDKRMSTISTDWKSVSGAGAKEAIRNSMAVPRNSSFSFGAIRPSSTYAVEADDAGNEKRSMSQMRTGVGLRNPAALTSTTSVDRVSRVSFAPDTRVSRVSFADSRPSGESRRTRAFHSAYIPPVPALPDNTDNSSEEAMAQFSPRQTQGAMALTPEDIHNRIPAAQKNENGSDLADFMPALSMMRTGGTQSEGPDDFLLSASAPAPPTPTYPKATSSTPAVMHSPILAAMPMQPMPAVVMSPDQMLRAYAERKKSMNAGKPVTTASISYPMPVADLTTAGPAANSNMRALYDAATGAVAPSPTHTGSFDGSRAATDDAESHYSAAESYQAAVGSQYAFGHHPNGSIGVGAYGGAQYAIGEDEDDSAVMARQAYGGHAA